MEQICATLGHPEYRIVFWNSEDYSQGRFVQGKMVIPFVVRKDSLSAAFSAATTTGGGGTDPSLGFKAIEPKWLENNPMIYFITDGQIGWAESIHTTRRKFAEEIRKLPGRLAIIAVEACERKFSSVEEVNSAAGGDIYKIICEERLTSKVTKFVSHCRNGVFVQIDKINAPVGHAPYGNKYFSVLRVPEFIEYLKGELKGADESTQLAIAQKLSSTLEVLTRDKPAKLSDDIIRTFSKLFTLDFEMIRYIITGAIEQERGGQAQVFASYRAQLKSLFEKADSLLKQDVSAAIGFGDKFESLTES
jgi:hypothetical protein